MLARFIIGALIYMGLEVLYDGTSHWSMGFVGGIAFILCGQYDEWFLIPDILLWLLIAITITVLEYIAGKIFNRHFQIWDYRKMPFNFQGQVCFTFFMIWWIVIGPVIVYFDNILRFIYP